MKKQQRQMQQSTITKATKNIWLICIVRVALLKRGSSSIIHQSQIKVVVLGINVASALTMVAEFSTSAQCSHPTGKYKQIYIFSG